MNNTNMHKNRKISRVIVIAVIIVASFLGKNVLRDRDALHNHSIFNANSKPAVSDADFTVPLQQHLGAENVNIYSRRDVDAVNGTPDFSMVCYLVGDKTDYTDIGYAFFDKQEINKKAGFMNIVSGYEAVLDKVEQSMMSTDVESSYTICSFDTLAYDNWTFNVSMFILVHNEDISTVELVLKNGQRKICEESYHKGVYEIQLEDRYSLDTINFYNTDGSIIAEYKK